MTYTNLDEAFLNHYDRHHERDGSCKQEERHFCYAASVNCRAGLTANEVALVAKRPNPSMCVSTVGAIKQARFEVDPTPGSPTAHCDLFLPPERPEAKVRQPDLADLHRLRQAFGEPVNNPGKMKR